MSLDQQQKDFIKGRVKELGSAQAVKEFYSREDAVCEFANKWAKHLRFKEAGEVPDHLKNLRLVGREIANQNFRSPHSFRPNVQFVPKKKNPPKKIQLQKPEREITDFHEEMITKISKK